MIKKLKNNDFDPNTVASKLNLSGVQVGSFTHELIKRLNVNLHGYGQQPSDSIMIYGNLCNCDSFYMCEHRLQNIVDFNLIVERKMKIDKIKRNIK